MAAIDDAMATVNQQRQDSSMVRGMLDGMAEHMTAQAGSVDVTPDAEGNLAAKPAAVAPRLDDEGGETPGQPDEPDDATMATGGAEGDLASYMAAASGTESGGNPNATNARTGAAGKFQIMPSNWASWAKDAGVDPGDHSPAAQDKVAGHKMQQYYDQFGSWGAVAVAWYAGPSAAQHWVENPQAAVFNRKQGNGDEPSINSYVATVLGRMKAVAG